MTSVVLFYIGPLYLNVVPWLEKIPADAHHFKTFSHLKNMHIFTRPMLMYKDIITSQNSLFDGIICH